MVVRRLLWNKTSILTIIIGNPEGEERERAKNLFKERILILKLP